MKERRRVEAEVKGRRQKTRMRRWLHKFYECNYWFRCMRARVRAHGRYRWRRCRHRRRLCCCGSRLFWVRRKRRGNGGRNYHWASAASGNGDFFFLYFHRRRRCGGMIKEYSSHYKFISILITQTLSLTLFHSLCTVCFRFLNFDWRSITSFHFRSFEFLSICLFQ